MFQDHLLICRTRVESNPGISRCLCFSEIRIDGFECSAGQSLAHCYLSPPTVSKAPSIAEGREAVEDINFFLKIKMKDKYA